MERKQLSDILCHKLNSSGPIGIIISFIFGKAGLEKSKFEFSKSNVFPHKFETKFFPLHSCTSTSLNIQKNEIKNIYSISIITNNGLILFTIPGFCIYDPDATNIVGEQLFTHWINHKVKIALNAYVDAEFKSDYSFSVEYSVPKNDNEISQENKVMVYREIKMAIFNPLTNIGEYFIYENIDKVKNIYFKCKNEGKIYISTHNLISNFYENKEELIPEIIHRDGNNLIKKVNITGRNGRTLIQMKNCEGQSLFLRIKTVIKDSDFER